MALHHPQNILGHVFACHKPRCVLTPTALRTFFFDAADSQALTLPQCVKTQTHMLANGPTARVFDGSGFLGDVAI